MNTTVARKLQWEELPDNLDFDLQDAVKSASRVIAPLGPINTFAARHPWVGLEEQSFEETARFLKDTCNLDIYPNDSVLQSARERSGIRQDFLEKELQHWLKQQSLEIPHEDAERFCMAALLQNDFSPSSLAAPELKSMATKLKRFIPQMKEKHAVVQTYSQRLEQMGRVDAAQELNSHLIKWCKLYLDESQAVLPMPHREEGFYRAWRKLVVHDPALSRKVRKQLSELPEEAETALMEVLLSLKIPFSEIQDYLQVHLLSLPGWGGMMLWHSQNSSEESSLLLNYLAVRISMEWASVTPFLPLLEKGKEKIQLEPLIAAWAEWGNLPIHAWSQLSPSEMKARLALAYRFDKILRNRLWLEAWEKTYEEKLKRLLLSQQKAKEIQSAQAQFIFCIDVRSEPFRRQLEKAGDFETFGTAGFFGLPIETCELGSNHTHHSLPVLFKPQHKVKEFSEDAQIYEQRFHAVRSLGDTFKTMKHNLVSSMVLPEISGPWLSLQTLARSFVPRRAGRTLNKLRETWLHKPATKLSLDHNETEKEKEILPIGFSQKEKVHYVRQALKMMGLTDQFAPLVVICGHGSHSTNNPYRSSLDCGACGGASSGFNARVLAALCNLPNVRQSLETEGIVIPKETVFAAAEHITTRDELHWLYVPELTEEAKIAFDHIQEALPKVSEETANERIPLLPNLGTSLKNHKAEAERLAEDWSEVRPEWGLARNAAFIIGERRLTQDCNLEGRVFLNNYNWKKDKNGVILANIISGPATVAQWINLQYYASTVAPHYYGSGNKTTQTVTAGLGVMQGNASDLLSGLPWQSVMKSDEEAYHEPLRLLVVIQAPKEYVKRVLDHDQAFRQKVKNGWIHLASIDQEGHWESWS